MNDEEVRLQTREESLFFSMRRNLLRPADPQWTLRIDGERPPILSDIWIVIEARCTQ